MDPLETLETDQLRPGVTVAICCHNSAARLPETLRHLQAQQNAGLLAWEVLVINNASSDTTPQAARSTWPASMATPLRIVDEPKAGLSQARIRAFREARYEVISFIDDDNWVPPNWVEQIDEFFRTHPEITALGCGSEPVFEVPPPIWMKTIEGFYAIGSQHAFNGDITNQPGTLLWGAGLALRTQAARDILAQGFSFTLSGRKGKEMSTGEDTELCFSLRAAGARLWYKETPRLKHFIPKERLTLDYANRLFQGVGRASPWIDVCLLVLKGSPGVQLSKWKKTWTFLFLKALKNLLWYSLENGRSLLQKNRDIPKRLGLIVRIHSLFSLWKMKNGFHKTLAHLRDDSLKWRISA
ncbi:N/A [soil metagenome]